MTNVLSTAAHALIPYAIAQWSGYRPANHHRRIADALERIASGKSKRLMIFVPPRFGKSMLVSQYFPAWYLGRNPDHYFIAVTYAQELADDWGRKVRDQLRDPLHQTVFPECRLREDSAAMSRLHTEQDGSYHAVGVGGAITGRGAHVLDIDDPIKGREEAESDTHRRKLRDWYTSVARTRLMPDGAIVITLTRWHEDDLAGWLLREHAHEGWEVISLPALDTAGKSLWPEAYPVAALHQIQRSLGPRDWCALYQQEPVADTGGFFEDKDFKLYDVRPKDLKIYGTSDYAVTSDGGDWTELAIWGVDKGMNVYALDWRSERSGADKWINTQIDLMSIHQPLTWYGEAGPIRRSIEPFLNKTMNERGTFCTLKWLPSIASKDVRLRGFQAMAKLGKVFFPRARWADDVRAQLLKFPSGQADDKVDACGLLARALEEINAPITRNQAYKPPMTINGANGWMGS